MMMEVEVSFLFVDVDFITFIQTDMCLYEVSWLVSYVKLVEVMQNRAFFLTYFVFTDESFCIIYLYMTAAGEWLRYRETCVCA